MSWSLTLSAAPTEEPITVAEAKLHSRVTISDEDPLIGNYIKAARLYVEAFTKRQLVTATWLLKMDGFPKREIVVPLPPLSLVTSIAYTDENGNAQTLASSKYQVDTNGEPGRIKPTETEVTFPNTQVRTYNTVTVTFVAGYGGAAAVPERFKQAIKMLVGHWHETRETISERPLHKVPLAVDALLMQDRMWSF